jgi:hypothetical protein
MFFSAFLRCVEHAKIMQVLVNKNGGIAKHGKNPLIRLHCCQDRGIINHLVLRVPVGVADINPINREPVITLRAVPSMEIVKEGQSAAGAQYKYRLRTTPAFEIPVLQLALPSVGSYQT